MAIRLWNQAGCVSVPPFEPTTTTSAPSSRYMSGVSRACPLLRPRWCRTSTGTPINLTPQRPRASAKPATEAPAGQLHQPHLQAAESVEQRPERRRRGGRRLRHQPILTRPPAPPAHACSSFIGGSNGLLLLPQLSSERRPVTARRLANHWRSRLAGSSIRIYGSPSTANDQGGFVCGVVRALPLSGPRSRLHSRWRFLPLQRRDAPPPVPSAAPGPVARTRTARLKVFASRGRRQGSLARPSPTKATRWQAISP